MKDSNNIEDILHNKLYNIEMTPSADGWNELKHTMTLRRKRLTLRRYYLASGIAAALVAVALIIGSLTNNDVAVEQLLTENRQQQTENKTTESESIASSNLKVESSVAQTHKVGLETKKKSHVTVATVKSDDAKTIASNIETSQKVEKDTTQTYKMTAKAVQHVSSSSTAKRQSQYFAPEIGKQNRQPTSRWSADIATSGAMLSSNNTTNGSDGVATRYALTEISALNSTKSDINSADMKHKLPVSVGVAVKYKMLPRLSIETGITYSYLESNSKLQASAHYLRIQELHYVGVPLNISYRFAIVSKVEFYTSIGGMAEWLVDGKSTTTISKDNHQISKNREDITENSPLWSANFGVGIGYNFIEHLGVFIEPGVSYYFTNNSQPASYKTENVFSFNLRLGFRTTF